MQVYSMSRWTKEQINQEISIRFEHYFATAWASKHSIVCKNRWNGVLLPSVAWKCYDKIFGHEENVQAIY